MNFINKLGYSMGKEPALSAVPNFKTRSKKENFT